MRGALFAAFALAGFASLLQLALPLYALHVLESAVPAASLETLALLTLIAAGAVVLLVCIKAARARIVLRAALWLDHTLGQHILENGARGGASPLDVEKRASALALLTGALQQRAANAALEALWLPVALAALVLLSPTMGAVAAASASILILAMIARAGRAGRLARQEAQANRNTAAWWSMAIAGSADAGLPARAADDWERLNRARVGAAYALGKDGANLEDLQRLVHLSALVGSIGVGAWLVMSHQLTPPALLACVLITAASMAPLQGFVAFLPAAGAAAAAYRYLCDMPADAGSDAGGVGSPGALSQPAASASHLNVRGPIAVGTAAVALSIALALGAAHIRLGDLAGIAGGAVFETRRATLQYAKASGARVHVAEGATVQKGDLIVTRDTADLDQQIVMLKALTETAKSQLVLIGRETSTMLGPAEAAHADRPKLAALEQRVAELEKETKELMSRIARAEQELARSEIRAPVSGRVVALNVRGGDAPDAPGVVELEIATADRALLGRLLDPMMRGMRAMSVAAAASESEQGPKP